MNSDLWVIVSGDAVVYGPLAWCPYAFSHQLGLLGWSVSLGTVPSDWHSPSAVEVGCDGPGWPETPAAILPCIVTCPPFDPDYRARSVPTFAIGDDVVTARYGVEDRLLAEVQTEAAARINREAGATRALYVTVATGQEGTYTAKEREARAYAMDPAPDPVRYPYLSAEAAFTHSPIAAIAALILATADAWTAVNAEIEGRRRGALEAVKTAADVTAVAALFPIPWPEG